MAFWPPLLPGDSAAVSLDSWTSCATSCLTLPCLSADLCTPWPGHSEPRYQRGQTQPLCPLLFPPPAPPPRLLPGRPQVLLPCRPGLRSASPQSHFLYPLTFSAFQPANLSLTCDLSFLSTRPVITGLPSPGTGQDALPGLLSLASSPGTSSPGCLLPGPLLLNLTRAAASARRPAQRLPAVRPRPALSLLASLCFSVP